MLNEQLLGTVFCARYYWRFNGESEGVPSHKGLVGLLPEKERVQVTLIPESHHQRLAKVSKRGHGGSGEGEVPLAR